MKYDGPDSISTNIPTSFVFRPIKLIQDKGHGESKLYIGSTEDTLELEKFFSYWDEKNKYTFVRENIINFLGDMKDEFLFTKTYKQVGKSYFSTMISKIVKMSNLDFEVNLTPFADARRYYIRDLNGKNSFWDVFRRIAIPLKSELEIIRNEQGENIEYLIYLWRSDKTRIRAHTRRGKEIGLQKRYSRYIPQKIKDRVWQRDKGMCRANHLLDPSLDKTTQETCDNNQWLHYDHIIPYSKNGPTTINNLQLLCRKHNLMKSDKDFGQKPHS